MFFKGPRVTAFNWSCRCESVIGPTHIAKGMPNQDAIGSFITTDDRVAILAVADGHGSERCVKSDIGSKLAVSVAIKQLKETVSHLNDRIDFRCASKKDLRITSAIRSIKQEIPIEICRNWREQVDQHHRQDELSTAVDYLVYGTTLLAVAITSDFAILLQIGDGDILVVDSNQMVESPLKREELKIGDDTNSLCQRNAEKYFSVEFLRFATDADRPSAFLLTTDGFANAFKDRQSLYKSAVDFEGLLRSESGLETLDAHLRSWLQEYATFSGDDTTLGMLFPVSNDETVRVNHGESN